MFQYLTDFSYKRDWKGAIGFYIAYFILGVLLGMMSGVLFGFITEVQSYDVGVTVGQSVGAVVGVIFSLVVAGLLVTKKQLYKKFAYILLVVVTGLLAVFGGLLLGMIIPAIMTTKHVYTK